MMRSPPRIGLAFPGSPVERNTATAGAPGSLSDAETGHFKLRDILSYAMSGGLKLGQLRMVSPKPAAAQMMTST